MDMNDPIPPLPATVGLSHPIIETEFLSRREVARLFGVSLSTVTRWARTGMIPTVRTPGGHYRYPAAQLVGTLPSIALVNANPEKGGPHERHSGTQ
ncbi:MAG TPA: helix-turn-helix domain-containing protein [Thermoanaerobaculia bacterium]|jgi:excisionase family DNA binding protein